MRLHKLAVIVPGLVAGLVGCTRPVAAPEDEGLITAVAGIVETNPLSPSAAVSVGGSAPAGVRGSVGSSEYQLFDLGPAVTGQQWQVANQNSRAFGDAFLVVLLNSDFDLLRRQVVAGGLSVAHIVRADTPTLYLGIAPSTGSGGGDFRFEIGRREQVDVPAPQPQVVWLNFDGATDLRIHARTGVTFGAFDAAKLGAAYAGATEIVKGAIVATMQEDYGAYDVTILTSDDGPPPEGPYATLNFGSYDKQLLGLADNVDQYNADPRQNAIIYVEGFAAYAVMGLSDEEMGDMVGNVASHEFGHLLGLFHTQLPTDLMDTSGTAWDLAGAQGFSQAPLEPTVFPIGFENSPARLAETVGGGPSAESGRLAKPLATERIMRKAALRKLVKEELHQRCGTCLDLDP